MDTKAFTFLCAYCGIVTASLVEVAARSDKPGKKITITRTCKGYQQPNVLTVPDTWDFRPLALGDDSEVVEINADGTPMFEGRKET